MQAVSSSTLRKAFVAEKWVSGPEEDAAAIVCLGAAVFQSRVPSSLGSKPPNVQDLRSENDPDNWTYMTQLITLALPFFSPTYGIASLGRRLTDLVAILMDHKKHDRSTM